MDLLTEVELTFPELDKLTCLKIGRLIIQKQKEELNHNFDTFRNIISTSFVS